MNQERNDLWSELKISLGITSDSKALDKMIILTNKWLNEGEPAVNKLMILKETFNVEVKN